MAKFDQTERDFKYVGILNDEIASVEFAYHQGFKMTQRKRKMIKLDLRGSQEYYEELGTVTTKAVQGQFMTICAVKVVGTKTGILYMKGSIASLKNYI